MFDNVQPAMMVHASPSSDMSPPLCSHVDSFADVDLDYLTSIHELETSSSHDMLSFAGKSPAFDLVDAEVLVHQGFLISLGCLSALNVKP